jgi:hypothetical protein
MNGSEDLERLSGEFRTTDIVGVFLMELVDIIFNRDFQIMKTGSVRLLCLLLLNIKSKDGFECLPSQYGVQGME